MKLKKRSEWNSKTVSMKLKNDQNEIHQLLFVQAATLQMID